jgi:hypothetical protein
LVRYHDGAPTGQGTADGFERSSPHDLRRPEGRMNRG